MGMGPNRSSQVREKVVNKLVVNEVVTPHAREKER